MGEISETIGRETGQAPNGVRLLFDFEIELQEHSTKKNNKSIGYRWAKKQGSASRLVPFIRSSTQNKLSENFLVSCLRRRAADLHLLEPISHPVRAMFVFELTNLYTKSGQVKLRRNDLSNLLQGPEHALVKAGILKDDALILSFDGTTKKQSAKNKLTIKIFDHPIGLD